MSPATVHYVCYNDISYIVSAEHALARSDQRSVILYEPGRVQPRARYDSIRHKTLTRRNLVLACLAAALDRFSVVYIPHHRTSRLVRWLADIAARVGLVDDGLDTLREVPRQVDLRRTKAIESLITFENYAVLASWTRQLRVERAGRLESLRDDARPALPIPDTTALVIVESPGVDISEAISAAACNRSDSLVIVHGNPHKRQSLMPDQASMSAKGHDLEGSLARFSGKVVCGESMVAVYLLHVGYRGRLTLQWTAKQHANLVALHPLIHSSGVRLLLQQEEV